MRIITLLFIFFCFEFNAQTCISDTIYFESQQQIDDFPINYPSCTEISGSIYIVNNDEITNLDGLNQIIRVNGALHLFNLSQLNSLSGLSNLQFVGDRLNLSTIPNIPNLGSLNNLSNVGGDVRVKNCSGLTDLSGLENLVSIGGSFSVSEHENLVNLTGIENLMQIGGILGMSQNPLLTSISQINEAISINGLNIFLCPLLETIEIAPMVTEVGEDIHIANNTSLATIAGFDSLEKIGDFLNISNCPNVTNISAFSSLQEIGGTFWLSDAQITDLSAFSNLNTVGFNPLNTSNTNMTIVLFNLESLSGLENLDSLKGALQITFTDITTLLPLEDLDFSNVTSVRLRANSLLTDCSVFSFCNFVNLNPSITTLDDNNTGCNSTEEVLENCDDFLSSLNYFIFYDLNENGQPENEEPFYTDGGLIVEPNNNTSVQSSNGGGIVYLEVGNYTIEYDQNRTPNWELTTAPDIFNITIESPADNDSIFFGIKPLADISNLITYTTSAQTRCNEIGIYRTAVKNIGTTTASGILWLEIDNQLELINFITSPDTSISPNQYGWFFSELYPSQSFQANIEVRLPGPPDFSIGDNVYVKSFTEYDDITGFRQSNPSSYETLILCSYDPNDKLVNPNRNGNYTLFEEPLIYTIRFQNTGNAEALMVRIEDQLSPNLDLSTFRILSSSHEEVLTTTITEEGLINFTFTDINLPDSTSNLEESQGFVTFYIKPKTELSEGTEIFNSADIYFDLNPPIFTNETKNILASDDDMDGFFSIEDCNDQVSTIYPGALEIPNNQIDEDCDGFDLITLNTENIESFYFHYTPNPTSNHIEIKTNLTAPYNYSILNTKGQIVNSNKIYSQEEIISLQDLSNGLYFIKIQTDKEIHLFRIVVQKSQ